MPARTYYFSSQNITRDGKHKKAIPNSQWKGPGGYYLRENAAGTERYWAKRNISMDAKRSRPKKDKNIGYGVYSQYHDKGTGKHNVKKIKLKKYPNTDPRKKPSQAKISRATLQRTKAEKRKLAKSRRRTAKSRRRTAKAKAKPAKRRSVKRTTRKRKSTRKRKGTRR